MLVQSDLEGVAIPEGHTLRSVAETSPADWDRRHGALYTIVWDLNAPNTADRTIYYAIYFTVFPSGREAAAAWDNGKPHLPREFKVESVTTPPYLFFPARLVNGTVKSDNNGFSDASGQLSNVLIRATTVSSLVTFGADAHAAVDMLALAGSELSSRFHLELPPN
jgi:hypothetical protein